MTDATPEPASLNASRATPRPTPKPPSPTRANAQRRALGAPTGSTVARSSRSSTGPRQAAGAQHTPYRIQYPPRPPHRRCSTCALAVPAGTRRRPRRENDSETPSGHTPAHLRTPRRAAAARPELSPTPRAFAARLATAPTLARHLPHLSARALPAWRHVTETTASHHLAHRTESASRPRLVFATARDGHHAVMQSCRQARTPAARRPRMPARRAPRARPFSSSLTAHQSTWSPNHASPARAPSPLRTASARPRTQSGPSERQGPPNRTDLPVRLAPRQTLSCRGTARRATEAAAYDQRSAASLAVQSTRATEHWLPLVKVTTAAPSGKPANG